MNEDLLTEPFVFLLFTLVGISLIIQSKLWVKLVHFLYSQNEQTFKIISLTAGLLSLPLGLFLVLTHNDWSMKPSIIITIMCWLILIKSTVLIICPQLALKAKSIYGKSESFLRKYLIVCGLLYVISGIWVQLKLYTLLFQMANPS